jgi:cytochrome P450
MGADRIEDGDMSTALAAPRQVRGPRGRGAALRLASLMRDPLAGYLGMFAAYGDTIRVPISPKNSFFVLTRPEHAEHVLAVNQDNYVKAFTYRPLRALIGNGLLTSEGEQWRQHRRIIQPIFARRDVRSFGPAMTGAIDRTLAAWAELPDGAVLDAAAAMSGLALDVVGRALFSTDLTGDAEQLGRAMSTGQKLAVLATFAPLSFGPRSTRALKALARTASRTEGIEAPVGRLIAERRRERDPVPGRRDLLDVLLTARFDDGTGRTGTGLTSTGLTDTEVSDELATFMLAGHETSAVTLSWALALLSAYPAARDRLEAEVDAVLSRREPEAADADRLPWTTAVIAETMRLYPPAWTIERDAVADDDVAGVPVPAGSTVAIPPYLVHRHPEFWPDPAGFDPARFLAGTGDRRPAPDRPRYSYIPFGGGKRACVGQSFAELETVLALAAIARRFRLELTAAGVPKPVAAVTLRPGRLPMRLRRR